MKFIALAVAAVALSIAPAWSADFPVKAIYKAPPVDVWNWGGFYAGVNAGYSLGNDPFIEAVAPYGQPNGPFGETGRLNSVASPSGAVLGGQLGYNWQFDHVVLGLEGDAQWTGQRNTSCSFNCIETNDGEISAETVSHQLTWFGTVRARLGWATGETLFYVTGGPAWGGLRQTVAAVVDFAPNATSTTDTTSVGWAAGVGIETRLWGNWTWKAEYLHVQLAGSSSFADIPARCGLANGFINCQGSYSIATSARSLSDEIIRVGLNYHLGGAQPGPAAVLSPVPPAPVSWTGFYAGVNGGYAYGSDPYTQQDFYPCGGPGCVTSSYAAANITPRGPVAGGQAGYDLQIQHLVLGVEADMDWSGQHASACSLDCESDSVEPNSLDRTLNWIATVRGRIGVQTGGYFFYGTGGAALANVTDVTSLFGISQSFGFTRAGWAAGLGLEARLWGRWTGRIEYLHLDLGSVTETQSSPALTVSSTTNITDNLVRVGLNYQFAQ